MLHHLSFTSAALKQLTEEELLEYLKRTPIDQLWYQIVLLVREYKHQQELAMHVIEELQRLTTPENKNENSNLVQQIQMKKQTPDSKTFYCSKTYITEEYDDIDHGPEIAR